ncbi:MAG: DinB family protein [Bacteroidota bacterium]|nr:DinB family protein [Bacteroidota bacterium]MDP4235860.1 DinB family protein [Bacteroidota bacterium]
MKDKLKRLEETIKHVTDFAERFPPGMVTLKPDLIAFSANEIIYHLLEVEELWQRRIKQLLHTSDRHFQQIDPDALAKEHRYNEQSYEEGIAKWKAARKQTIALVSGMTPEQSMLKGIHSRYGEMDTARILDTMADHDMQHLRQMERTLATVSK